MQRNERLGRRRVLRLLSVVVPLCLLGPFYAFSIWALSSWPWYVSGSVVVAGGTAGVMGFSLLMFRVIDRQDLDLDRQYADLEQRYATERRLRTQMEALHQASLAIAAVQDMDATLQRIVDLARDVIGARYGALAVTGSPGEIDAFYTSGIPREDRLRIGAPPSGRGLLGAMLRQSTAIRLDDLTADARRAGFPPGHPAMQTLVGVPVTHAGNCLGTLYLSDKIEGPEFAQEDEDLLGVLASYAAVVIVHARMAQRIRTLGVAAERERVRTDLPDSALQAIYGVNLELECACDDLEASPDAARGRIEGAMERLEGVIKQLRNHVLALKPQEASATLPEALAALLEQARAHTLLDTELSVQGLDAVEVPQPLTEDLVHIAREAVSNVVRHARAGRVWITLQAAVGFVELEIIDNGSGFDTRAMHTPEHQGLRDMRNRALALGGRVTIQSELGGGATVRVRIPVATGGQGDSSV